MRENKCGRWKDMTLLIKNGRVIDPATGTDEVMDLFIEDDTIVKRDKKIEEKADKTMENQKHWRI